ncbi:hypothetical protein AVEN_233937-1 [Araneus ventricosus]|uniref:Tc1-like transposase DDE domain-containing protein n=1 Tax=Araneus ventricosus TaxID=182803 RepID=A0A4Y2LIU8_ARAVE|nr:hypothetical protein AVEN_233937-1 [Araneus ventricosus]
MHKEMLSSYSKKHLFRQAVYCNIVSKLRDAFRRKRPFTGGILFHPNNARSYTAEKKTEEFPWRLLHHLPYRPELTPRPTFLARLNCSRMASVRD